MRSASAGVLALVFLALSPGPLAQDAAPGPPEPAPPRHIVRLGANYVGSEAHETIDISGGDVTVDAESTFGAFAEYEWRCSRRIGIPVSFGYARPGLTIDIPLVEKTTENTRLTTASLGLNFHFLEPGRVDLRAGIFGQYAGFSGRLDSTYAFGAAAGADFLLGEHGLALTAEVRWSQPSPEILVDLQKFDSGDLDFDLLVAGLGIAWRF